MKFIIIYSFRELITSFNIKSFDFNYSSGGILSSIICDILHFIIMIHFPGMINPFRLRLYHQNILRQSVRATHWCLVLQNMRLDPLVLE